MPNQHGLDWSPILEIWSLAGVQGPGQLLHGRPVLHQLPGGACLAGGGLEDVRVDDDGGLLHAHAVEVSQLARLQLGVEHAATSAEWSS